MLMPRLKSGGPHHLAPTMPAAFIRSVDATTADRGATVTLARTATRTSPHRARRSVLCLVTPPAPQLGYDDYPMCPEHAPSEFAPQVASPPRVDPTADRCCSGAGTRLGARGGRGGRRGRGRPRGRRSPGLDVTEGRRRPTRDARGST